MFVIMSLNATAADIAAAEQEIRRLGLRADVSSGTHRTVIGLVGNEIDVDAGHLASLPGVERVERVDEPYQAVALSPRNGVYSTVTIGNVSIGGGGLTVIAGQCAVETRELAFETGIAVKAAGATILRGEAFKPRSSPYQFQGIKEDGLKIMKEASLALEMPFVAEVLQISDIAKVSEYADALRVGTRNMSNYELLRALGEQSLPVILKRGMSSTLEEWLLAAEYIACKNGNVILCERGIRTFETATRNTLDLSAIPLLRTKTHLPIMVDPSHAVGVPSAIPAMALAAAAAGVDALMIDVHPRPSEALVDGAQALTPNVFAALMPRLQLVSKIAWSMQFLYWQMPGRSYLVERTG
jgi:3-deoxy-7-phosphoheptulonate synthase